MVTNTLEGNGEELLSQEGDTIPPAGLQILEHEVAALEATVKSGSELEQKRRQ